MRLQIYIPGKTQEDLALREALNGLKGPQLKELLVLGLAAKNSTTSSEPQSATSDAEQVSTTNAAPAPQDPGPCTEEDTPPVFMDAGHESWAALIRTGHITIQRPAGNDSPETQ